LKVLENRMLMRIFGPMKEEVFKRMEKIAK
jgi:hypothetical protein